MRYAYWGMRTATGADVTVVGIMQDRCLCFGYGDDISWETTAIPTIIPLSALTSEGKPVDPREVQDHLRENEGQALFAIAWDVALQGRHDTLRYTWSRSRDGVIIDLARRARDAEHADIWAAHTLGEHALIGRFAHGYTAQTRTMTADAAHARRQLIGLIAQDMGVDIANDFFVRTPR